MTAELHIQCRTRWWPLFLKVSSQAFCKHAVGCLTSFWWLSWRDFVSSMLPDAEKLLVPKYGSGIPWRGMGMLCSASYLQWGQNIWWQFCNRCVTPSLEPTPSYQNATDVIGQDLVCEFSHFFASDFKVHWWDLTSSCKVLDPAL